MISKNCTNCKKVFSVHNYRKNTAAFCSYICYWKSLLGKKYSMNHRIKISLSNRGKKLGPLNPQWKGGVSKINYDSRMSVEQRNWAQDGKRKDDYRCFDCGRKSGEDGVKKLPLHSDHIFPFSLFSRLRLDPNNHRTLCRDCHKKTETYGGKMRNIKKESFIFI